MTPGAESQRTQDWFGIAQQDLMRVGKRLTEGDVEDGAFHLQQAVEKYLKGYLLSQGWTLRKIHDVEELLNDAIRYNPQLERYRALCQRVSSYYVVERYPLSEEGPSLAEVRKAYAQAQRLARLFEGGRSRRSHR